MKSSWITAIIAVLLALSGCDSGGNTGGAGTQRNNAENASTEINNASLNVSNNRQVPNALENNGIEIKDADRNLTPWWLKLAEDERGDFCIRENDPNSLCAFTVTRDGEIASNGLYLWGDGETALTWKMFGVAGGTTKHLCFFPLTNPLSENCAMSIDANPYGTVRAVSFYGSNIQFEAESGGAWTITPGSGDGRSGLAFCPKHVNRNGRIEGCETFITRDQRLYAKGLRISGAKNFVQDHPTDPTKEIVYTSLEGDEAGTYTRGQASVVNGKATITLPEHFGMVTNEEGLTVQLTPIGEWLQLYIVEQSTSEITIAEASGKSGTFNFFVQGIRKGFENEPVIQEKKKVVANAE